MRKRHTKKVNEKVIPKRYCLSSVMDQSIHELFEDPKLRHRTPFPAEPRIANNFTSR
jgi:hypothetical protein